MVICGATRLSPAGAPQQIWRTRDSVSETALQRRTVVTLLSRDAPPTGLCCFETGLFSLARDEEGAQPWGVPKAWDGPITPHT